MGAAIGNLNKEAENTTESSENQTNQPDGSSVNQTNQPDGSSLNQANQPDGSSLNQANQTNESSVSQANQPNGSSVSQANQTNGSAVIQANQTNASSTNQTSQTKGSSPNQTSQTKGSSPNQTSQTKGSSTNQTSQTKGSSTNQTSQTKGSSPNQTSQTKGSSTNQTSQTKGSSTNQTSQTKGSSTNQASQTKGSSLENKKVTVVFVLGGPGSGKGTQCANIVKQYGYTHLSAGDLLRAEMNSGSENGTMIQKMIKEGKIVPAEVTIKLLQKAMTDTANDKFLIDGFPRNEENRAAFESVTGIEPTFILFFDCPEKEMEKRLLGRNQGREDDNIETIRKRFKVYQESSLPVINYYKAKGKVRKIDASKPADQVFTAVKAVFA